MAKDYTVENRVFLVEKEVISLAESQKALVHTVDSFAKSVEKQNNQIAADLKELSHGISEGKKTNWGWFVGAIGILVTVLGIYIRSETSSIETNVMNNRDKLTALSVEAVNITKEVWYNKAKLDMLEKLLLK